MLKAFAEEQFILDICKNHENKINNSYLLWFWPVHISVFPTGRNDSGPGILDCTAISRRTKKSLSVALG